MGRRLLLILALAASFAMAWLVLTGPRPKPASAPAAEFSAARAMTDVNAIAVRPHVVGSPENAAVRDYLLARMAALGLSPRVQSSVQVSQKTKLPVTAESLIGVLPGRDRAAPALTLMAHYDSTPRGPGAADDAAGTAAVLEAARALKADGVPPRDVLVVVTDGEEAGLLGAKAFFAGDPDAKRTGFLINLEARGSRGRAMMFETGRQNGETIAAFQGFAKRPVSNSLMVMVYELMPNYTDFTEAKARGVQGLNFAFLGGPHDYHAASDTPDNLDQRSLQDLGDQILAAARGVLAGPLPKAAPNLVYSDVLNLGILAYPAWGGWVVLGISLAMLITGAVQAGVKAREIAIGAGISLGLLVVGGGGLYLIQVAAKAMNLAMDDNALGIEAAGWALCLLLFGAWVQVAGRQRAGHWTGALLVGLVLATAAQAFAAPAAPILAWPLALACLSAAVTALGNRFTVAAAVIAAPAVAFVAYLAHLAFLSLLTPAALTPWPWLAALLLAPAARRVDYKPT